MPENTSKRDPIIHALGAMSEGPSDYITGMEAEGQRQLVASEMLPARVNHGTDDEFIALGFTFGEPDPNDSLFRQATLPPGWSKQPTDHSMWSSIVDERGIKRVSVFYKAAWYDRDAFMSLTNVGYALASEAIYGDGPVEVPWAKLTIEEAAEVRANAEKYIQRAKEHPGVAGIGDRAERAREVLEQAQAAEAALRAKAGEGA